MQTRTLEEIITTYVRLNRPASNGWRNVLCKVCNDHGRKGPRAGFMFDEGVVAYQCFNCGHRAVFDPIENTRMPSKMITVLNAFNIPESEWSEALVGAFLKDTPNTRVPKESFLQEPTQLTMPSMFEQLANIDHDIHQYAIEYLEDRNVDWKEYPFYVSTTVLDQNDTLKKYSLKWYARLIIPYYKNGHLIFYQGRDLLGTRTPKYVNAADSRDNVLSRYDFDDSSGPLYITEGWFDAYPLSGVAVFGNNMTRDQIRWLSKSHRQKIVIPDRFGDGHLLAKQALSLGWSVSTPEIGNCKDVNEAIKTYGLTYVKVSIAQNTTSGFAGETNVGLYCTSDKH